MQVTVMQHNNQTGRSITFSLAKLMSQPPPPAAVAVGHGDTAGLAVASTDTIRSFLLSAAGDDRHLTGELRELASDLSSRSSVSYRSLKSIWSTLPSDARPSLRHLFAKLMSQPPPPAAVAAGHGDTAGFAVASTDTIRSFLLSAAGDDRHLTGELRELASDLSSRSSVSYRSLKSIWSTLPSDARPSLRHLFAGSDFVFASPKPREKSEELKERLKKLSEMEERRAYEELVKDVVPKKDTTEPFSSYKDQMGFGLHVALMMFTGYLVGYAAFRALFDHSAVMNAAGGILGLVCGMLLETVLFIIRASSLDIASSDSATKLKKTQ